MDPKSAKIAKYVRNLLLLFAFTSASGTAFATWDKHTHTSNDTISTWPTITSTSTHTAQVQAPANGGLMNAKVWQGQTLILFSGDAAFGQCRKATGTLSTNANPPYRFYSKLIDYRDLPGTACLFNAPYVGCCGESQPNGPEGE